MKSPNPIHIKARRAPKRVRIVVGVLLVIGGLFGFLPVLGFWMIPLGLIVLAFDIPWVRQQLRRFRTRWKERKRSGGERLEVEPRDNASAQPRANDQREAG